MYLRSSVSISGACLFLIYPLWQNTLTRVTQGRIGLFWFTVAGHNASWQGNQGLKISKQLVRVRLRSAKEGNECLHDACMPVHSSNFPLYLEQFPLPEEWSYPECTGLPTSANIIKRIPHRFPRRLQERKQFWGMVGAFLQILTLWTFQFFTS